MVILQSKHPILQKKYGHSRRERPYFHDAFDGRSTNPLLFLARATERKISVLNVDGDPIAVGELATEDCVGQFVLQAMLNDSLQRASSVNRIVTLFGELLSSRIGDVQRKAVVFDSLFQPNELQVYDLSDFVSRQRMEHDDFVNTVKELGQEFFSQRLQDSTLDLFIVFFTC